MKIFFVALFVCLTQLSFCNTYYFSSSKGNDNYTATQAQNPNTPWASIVKLNSFFSSIVPGDTIKFKRGDVFTGTTLLPTVNGTAARRIVFDAYGTGPNPVLSGFTTLNSWTSNGKGIYSVSIALPSTSLKLLLFDGVNQPMGRFPKKGYITSTDMTATSATTDQNALPASLNFTGGEAVVRTARYLIDRTPIASQSNTGVASSLTYAATNKPSHGKGLGFFIQNHMNTLTQLGDWYYDAAGQKLFVYFGKEVPSSHTVQVPVLDFLFKNVGKSYYTVQHIDFTGAGNAAIDVTQSASFNRFVNCHITYCGAIGIHLSTYGSSSTNEVNNCTISYCNDKGILLTGAANSIIKNNTISNNGTIIGMGASGNNSLCGIYTNVAGIVIDGNKITNTGGHAIRFDQANNVVVQNNFIDTCEYLLDDGGGIYSWKGKPNSLKKTSGILIKKNIILHVLGAQDGAVGNNAQAFGIYMDEFCQGVLIDSNFVSDCIGADLYLHNCNNITVTNNQFFNPAGSGDQYLGISIIHDAATTSDNAPYNSNGLVVTHNFVATEGRAAIACVLSTYSQISSTDVGQFGVIDSNYYAHPDAKTALIRYRDKENGVLYKNLQQWQAMFGYDAHSTLITSSSPMVFKTEYNPTNKTITKKITGRSLQDLKGNQYSNSLELPPFSGIILVQP